MEILDVLHKEYSQIFPKPYHVFNSVEFNLLNHNKCDELKFFLFKERKIRLGLIAGIKNQHMFSSFSAPFGGFSFLNKNVQIMHIENAIEELEIYCEKANILSVKFILPPLFYNEIFLTKLINVLFRKNYNFANIDIDFYIKIFNFEKNYSEKIWYNAKKNLKISQGYCFNFDLCIDDISKNEVYQIIKENRKNKNKPLNMSFEQIINTSKIINTDFFILRKEKTNIAGAIVYHISDNIVYIPFWADKSEYSDSRPMNFLSFKIFEFYYHKKFEFVHLGISTEDSLPNYGLCEFKESIGCELTPKFMFTKIFIEK